MKNILSNVGKGIQHFTQRKKLRERARDLKALSSFIQQSTQITDLSNEIELKNLHQGLVEILWPNGDHAANGLLVTNNGYFVTDRHCLEDGISEEGSIQLWNGSRYRIAKVCVIGNKDDIALAKAEVEGEAIARSYPVYRENQLRQGTSVVLLSRWNGKVETGHSSVTHPTLKVKGETETKRAINNNCFAFRSVSVGGDSGGAVIDPVAMKLIGSHVGRAGEGWYSYGTAFHKVLDMVDHYIKHMR